MEKVLVVVYSLTGTSRRLAESLALPQQWALGEVGMRRKPTLRFTPTCRAQRGSRIWAGSSVAHPVGFRERGLDRRPWA